MTVTLRRTCLVLALGLATLGLDFACEAHLLGPGEHRHLLNPFNIIDDVFKNIPVIGSPVPGAFAGALGPFGPYGVNIPGVNSFDDYMRFLGLSPHGPNFGTIPGPTYPVPSQPLPPHSGTPPKPDNYPPVVGPSRPPHGNSPGTGPAPPQPGSGGPVVPPRPDNTPDKQPAVPAGGTDTPAEQGGPGAPCLDKPECEPGENDSYIHLIDPRQGKN